MLTHRHTCPFSLHFIRTHTLGIQARYDCYVLQIRKQAQEAKDFTQLYTRTSFQSMISEVSSSSLY